MVSSTTPAVYDTATVEHDPLETVSAIADVPPKPHRSLKTRWIAAGAVVAVLAAAAAIVVPLQVQAAERRDAVDAYARAAQTFDAAVVRYAAGEDALTARYTLAATQVDGLTGLLSRVPDEVVDPVAAKQSFADAIAGFKKAAGVTSTDAGPSTPMKVSNTLGLERAASVAKDADTSLITSLTAKLRTATTRYETKASANAATVKRIDDSYAAALTQLDGLMAAGRTWGNRDVYPKDTPEQTATLTAAAQALVKPDGQSFTGIEDRAAAVDAFLGRVEERHPELVFLV